MITVQRESLHNCLDEVKELVLLHWEEIAMYKDGVPLDPNYEQFVMLEDSGICHLFTARDGSKMVGYAIFFTYPHIHYQSTKFSNCDVIFILKEHRGGQAAKKLIECAELALTNIGVKVMHIAMKVYCPFDKLLTHLGYECIEKVFSKRV